MTAGTDRKPLFVHASQRSGSTYFFNVLRRMDALLCFDEAITDAFSYYGKKNFADRVARGRWNWSHDFLNRYSKAEFVEAWDRVMDLYPPAPAFRDYVPRSGVLSDELRLYLDALIGYAKAKQKRAALCEIFSRGRAGALRDAFGGFHIAQYRDPLSQFGSSFRGLQEFGAWTFLIIPLQELGLSRENPLYSLIPEQWRVPALPWPPDDRAQRWASTEEYISMILSSEPDALERVFRWHLLSWILNNLAAIVHSDLILDIDKAFDDLPYRNSIQQALQREIGITPDFADLTKFSRYYQFEAFDTARIVDESFETLAVAQRSGLLDSAVAGLARERPTVSPHTAIETLRAKVNSALSDMASTDKHIYVSIDDWDGLVRKHRHVWANARLRGVMQGMYPVVLPVVQAARRIGLMN